MNCGTPTVSDEVGSSSTVFYDFDNRGAGNGSSENSPSNAAKPVAVPRMLRGRGAHRRRRERYANADTLNTNVETGANNTVFYGFDNRGDSNGVEIAPGSAAGGTAKSLLLSGGGVHQRNKELDVGTDMPHVHALGANTKVLCALDDHGAGN